MIILSGFSKFALRPTLIEQLTRHGIAQPTEIQERCIPPLLQGQDVIGRAQTGTGKTLAFVLPILQRIRPEQDDVQALIIAPTRELALQITTEIKKLLTAEDGRVLAVYGGQDVEKQMKQLKNQVRLVVGTPGRLLDHLRRGTLNLGRLSMLVLDEADQMLHIGFLNEVEAILDVTPSSRQTMLFSATMPEQVQRLAERYMNKPQMVRVQEHQVTVQQTKQIAVETTDRGKLSALTELLGRYRPYLAVVFCRTKRRVSTLNEQLQEAGFDSDELHGDLSQAKREQVMKRFREARLQVLVATDVAARGLDVEGVTHVFNYDMPLDVESYIHRVGRTGRAGGDGLAVTLVTPRDNAQLARIEAGIRRPLKRQSAEGEPAGNAKSDARRSRSQDSERPRRDRRRSDGDSPGRGRGAKSASNGAAGRGRAGGNRGRSSSSPKSEGAARRGGGSTRGRNSGGGGGPRSNRSGQGSRRQGR